MAYCQKCGHQNPDDATFCNACGGPLQAKKAVTGKDWDKQCENECAGGPKGASVFWGIIVTLIGVSIAIWALKESSIDLPQWLEDLDVGLIFGIVIAAALIVTGISIIVKKSKS